MKLLEYAMGFAVPIGERQSYAIQVQMNTTGVQGTGQTFLLLVEIDKRFSCRKRTHHRQWVARYLVVNIVYRRSMNGYWLSGEDGVEIRPI